MPGRLIRNMKSYLWLAAHLGTILMWHIEAGVCRRPWHYQDRH